MYLPIDMQSSPYAHRPHHRNGKFRNPTGSAHQKDGRHSTAMLGLLAELALSGNRRFSYPQDHVYSRKEALASLELHRNHDAITWLGQACFYITLSGVSFLTDPFLSHRASPLPFSGPRRLVPAPIHINDLPRLDAFIISHNHYDHLDVATLRRWQDKNVPVITTLGCGQVVRALGYRQVAECDWYQELSVKNTSIECYPAYHFSGRSLFDSNQSLWGSFALRSVSGTVYFAGDTGYGDEFKRIGSFVGEVDVALSPIGAYAPRQVMAKVHASPEEGIALARDVGARYIIPMHWGTIRLTNEPMMEPRYRFERELHRLQKEGHQVAGSVFSIGETRKLSNLKPEI